MVTPLNSPQTEDELGIALKITQLQDQYGNASNVTDFLINGPSDKARKILAASKLGTVAQNLGSPPTVALSCLGVSSGTIGAAGTVYTAGDIVSLVGGTLASNGLATQFIVKTVSGGIPQTIALNPGRCGEYTAVPSGTVATTGGTGSGLTITVGGTSGSPVYPGKTVFGSGQQILTNSPLLTPLSGLWTTGVTATPTYMSRFIASGPQTSATQGAGFGIGTDSRYMDIAMSGGGGNSFVQVYVTDIKTGIRNRVQTADYSVGSASFFFYKFDFGSSTPRNIEMYFGNQITLRGFDFMPTAGVWPYQKPNDIKGIVLHDSYGEGTQSTNIVRDTYVYTLGEVLGCPNVISNGCGGTGVLRQNTDLLSNNFVQRVAAGDLNPSVIGNMDFVFLPNSVNDQTSVNPAWTDSFVSAAYQGLVTSVANIQPGALIIGTGPEAPSATKFAQSRYDSLKAAFLAVANLPYNNPNRFIWVDNSPSGDLIQTGTGNTVTPVGDGVNDIYLSSDNTHPNSAGYSYLGLRTGNQIMKALKTLSGQ